MDELDALRAELEQYKSEKDKIRDVVGQIGGKTSLKWHNLLNIVFLVTVLGAFLFDLSRYVFDWKTLTIPPFLLLEAAVLLVSLKIIWMIHMQTKVDHFQFWILNTIEFRVNMITRRLASIESAITRLGDPDQTPREETAEPQPRFSITPTSSLTLLDLPSGNYGLFVAVFEDVTNTLLASQAFPGLFTIPALEVPDLPAGLFPGDLSLSVSADKALYGPGETVQLRLGFMNTGPVVSDVTATAYIVGTEGTSIARFTGLDFTAVPGLLVIREVQWTVPDEPAAGSYGVQVFAIDPATFVSGDPQLLQDVIPNVFSVGVRPLRSGDVDISAPTADPVSQQDELLTDIRFSITNTGQVQAPLEVQIIVIDSETGGPLLELLPALVVEPAR
ncbi:hypothetical protein LCGC14_2502590, partial [marine sediment metagenome]